MPEVCRQEACALRELVALLEFWTITLPECSCVRRSFVIALAGARASLERRDRTLPA